MHFRWRVPDVAQAIEQGWCGVLTMAAILWLCPFGFWDPDLIIPPCNPEFYRLLPAHPLHPSTLPYEVQRSILFCKISWHYLSYSNVHNHLRQSPRFYELHVMTKCPYLYFLGLLSQITTVINFYSSYAICFGSLGENKSFGACLSFECLSPGSFTHKWKEKFE